MFDTHRSDDANIAVVEARLVRAAWTLRRSKDPEQAWLNSDRAYWPEFRLQRADDYVEDQTAFEVRINARLTKSEIDDMQPALDLLLLLPDKRDRSLAFAVAWHFDGVMSERICWAKVRTIIAVIDPASGYVNKSRWTLKRYYDRSVDFIAQAASTGSRSML